ncbi:hypothetical protein ABNG03_18185 [Halorubrum sp. RMP-47]|uniref:hypothetical protein n=1 Tax=Halorubrum miltondacostae TaxID=3076378 RepID=UPI0035299E04
MSELELEADVAPSTALSTRLVQPASVEAIPTLPIMNVLLEGMISEIKETVISV